MSTLYLLKYNNYYNRIVKRADTIAQYTAVSQNNGFEALTIENVNFIPNDYVDTKQVVNISDYTIPDYILVTEFNDIVSRWFVVSSSKTSYQQVELKLHRDLVADYMDEVLDSTAYIKRGQIPSTNPLIFNSEDMKFNQIKKSESLLYDKTNSAWIVGYVPLNVTGLINTSIDFSGNQQPLTNYSELLGYSQNNIKVLTGTPYLGVSICSPKISTNKYYKYKYTIIPDNPTSVTYLQDVNEGNRTHFGATTTDTGLVANAFTSYFANRGPEIKGYLSSFIGDVEETNIYQQYNGRIVKNSSNQYFKVSVTAVGNNSYEYLTRAVDGGSTSLYTNLKNMILHNSYVQEFSSIARYELYAYYTVTEYQLTLTPYTYGDVSVELANHNHPKLQDAPYYMFCMKYTDKNYQLAMQMNMDNQENIIDIQLLPYCPAQDYFTSGGAYSLPTNPSGIYYWEKINGTPDYLMWCKKSVFSFDISFNVKVGDYKIDSECDMYRLCSPNGNGQFEFNVARNLGLSTINVDCTYRPYDPYVHLNPGFNQTGLYGADYNDFRGLILNGDFSIPAINDAWKTYTINNKNYQNIFNREIQSMELQNRYARTTDMFSALAGTVSAGISGVGAGIFMGNPALAAGLGLAGGAISGLAGLYDIRANEALRQEQIDLKKDLFTYNLRNIQAIPQSVSKTGCLTNNNKLVPYVEYYTCTEEEKNVLRGKIKQYGYTLGVTGRVGDYVSTGSGENNAKYIEADLIKIDINEDYHISVAIAGELHDGVRLA